MKVFNPLNPAVEMESIKTSLASIDCAASARLDIATDTLLSNLFTSGIREVIPRASEAPSFSISCRIQASVASDTSSLKSKRGYKCVDNKEINSHCEHA